MPLRSTKLTPTLVLRLFKPNIRFPTSLNHSVSTGIITATKGITFEYGNSRSLQSLLWGIRKIRNIFLCRLLLPLQTCTILILGIACPYAVASYETFHSRRFNFIRKPHSVRIVKLPRRCRGCINVIDNVNFGCIRLVLASLFAYDPL